LWAQNFALPLLALFGGTAKGEKSMLHFVWEAIIGLVVGAVAKLIMPGKDPGGIIVTMLLGVAGSLVASNLGRMIGWYQAGQSAGFIMSVLGAVLLLALYRLLKRSTA